MTHPFTEDDVGKRVEEPNGSAIGIVANVEDGRALVEPDPGAVDSIKAALGWELEAENPVPIESDAVAEVTDDAVRLETDATDDRSSEGGTDPVIERDEGEADRRDSSPGTGDTDPETLDQAQVEGEAGGDRHADNENAPPEGDRTVTTDRGRKDDR